MLAQVQKDGLVIVPVERGITHTDSGFTDGVVCGYLEYFDTHAGKQLTDADIHTWIKDALDDSRYDAIWLAGYIVGWWKGLKKIVTYSHTLASSVFMADQVGFATLRA